MAELHLLCFIFNFPFSGYTYGFNCLNDFK